MRTQKRSARHQREAEDEAADQGDPPGSFGATPASRHIEVATGTQDRQTIECSSAVKFPAVLSWSTPSRSMYIPWRGRDLRRTAHPEAAHLRRNRATGSARTATRSRNWADGILEGPQGPLPDSEAIRAAAPEPLERPAEPLRQPVRWGQAQAQSPGPVQHPLGVHRSR